MGLVSNFRYINTEANPADFLTRGLTFNQIKDRKLWWNGPSLEVLDLTIEEEPTEEVQVLFSVTKDDNFLNFAKFSSLLALINVFSYILKFVSKCRNLTYEFEYDKLLKRLILLDQNFYFSEQISLLQNGKRLRDYKNLNVIINDEMLCVQTRYVNHEVLPRFLILLSYQSSLTQLIIRQEHENSLHSSVKHTLNNLRCRYWIIQGKKTVKKSYKLVSQMF